MKKPPRLGGISSVGAPRFELGTSRTRTVRSTGLSHAPKLKLIYRKADDIITVGIAFDKFLFFASDDYQVATNKVLRIQRN